MRLALLFVLFLRWLPLNSQDTVYARAIVDTLCSATFHGRGPENDGVQLAAAFLEEEFRGIGLRSFWKSYSQPFELQEAISLFNDTLILMFNNKQLVPGRDYLLTASCTTSQKGNYSLKWLNKQVVNNKSRLAKFLEADHQAEFIVADPTGTKNKELEKFIQSMRFNPLKAKGVILVQDKKLTHGRKYGHHTSYPVFEVMKDKIPPGTKKVSFQFKCDLISNMKTHNIIGYVKGTEQPDSFIVFTAHYDHLGMMGSHTFFPGANDNASGTAMLLSLAKHYQKNPPKCSIAFIAFAAEELGLLGSRYYTEHPLFPLGGIKFLINMDIFGTGDEGIKVVNGTVHTEEFATLERINEQKDYLEQVSKRGRTQNSDHHHFSEKGVPAFFIYTLGGIKAYHDIYDKPEILPLTEFEDLFNLLTDFVTTFE